MQTPRAEQPAWLGDYCKAREGQAWTAEDTAEVLRQLRRIDEAVEKIVVSARTAVKP